MDNIWYNGKVAKTRWCSVCNTYVQVGREHPNAHAHARDEHRKLQEKVMDPSWQPGIEPGFTLGGARIGMDTYKTVSSNDMLTHLSLPNSPETLCGKIIVDEVLHPTTEMVCDICQTLAGGAKNFINEGSGSILEQAWDIERGLPGSPHLANFGNNFVLDVDTLDTEDLQLLAKSVTAAPQDEPGISTKDLAEQARRTREEAYGPGLRGPDLTPWIESGPNAGMERDPYGDVTTETRRVRDEEGNVTSEYPAKELVEPGARQTVEDMRRGKGRTPEISTDEEYSAAIARLQGVGDLLSGHVPGKETSEELREFRGAYQLQLQPTPNERQTGPVGAPHGAMGSGLQLQPTPTGIATNPQVPRAGDQIGAPHGAIGTELQLQPTPTGVGTHPVPPRYQDAPQGAPFGALRGLQPLQDGRGNVVVKSNTKEADYAGRPLTFDLPEGSVVQPHNTEAGGAELRPVHRFNDPRCIDDECSMASVEHTQGEHKCNKTNCSMAGQPHTYNDHPTDPRVIQNVETDAEMRARGLVPTNAVRDEYYDVDKGRAPRPEPVQSNRFRDLATQVQNRISGISEDDCLCGHTHATEEYGRHDVRRLPCAEDHDGGACEQFQSKREALQRYLAHDVSSTDVDGLRRHLDQVYAAGTRPHVMNSSEYGYASSVLDDASVSSEINRRNPEYMRGDLAAQWVVINHLRQTASGQEGMFRAGFILHATKTCRSCGSINFIVGDRCRACGAEFDPVVPTAPLTAEEQEEIESARQRRRDVRKLQFPDSASRQSDVEKVATNWTLEGVPIEDGFKLMTPKEANGIPFLDLTKVSISDKVHCADCDTDQWLSKVASCTSCAQFKCIDCIDTTINEFLGTCKKCANIDNESESYYLASDVEMDPGYQQVVATLLTDDDEIDPLFM